MFRKKAAAKVVRAAAAAAAAAKTRTPAMSPSTSSPTVEANPAMAGARPIGSRAKTLALIEKHRKILEEAQRHKEEMASITQEQESLQAGLATRAPKPAAATNTTKPLAKGVRTSAADSFAASPLPTEAANASAASVTEEEEAKPDAFTALVAQFLAATEHLADLDETLQQAEPQSLTSSSAAEPAKAVPSATATVTSASAVRPPILTHRSFAASLQCPKKFYLLQNRADVIPKASLGEMMHFDDSVGFNELARRWDRLQFGSRAVVVRESNFDLAVQHTEELIRAYFQGPYAALGEQAPTLTIHRPAFAVDFPGSVAGSHHMSSAEQVATAITTSSASTSPAVQLRARPTVIRFRPKEGQWTFIDSQAVIDPVSTSARITHTIQKFHFTILCFRLWLTQPRFPIEVRKKFMQVNLDGITAESLEGRSLESSARPAALVDLKRSGLLHIRQFFPGPVTLVDCAPSQLVKFMQRVSLEELLEEDSKHYGKENGRGHPFSHGFNGGGGGGAFDLRNFHASVTRHPSFRARASSVETVAHEIVKFTQSRSSRSQRYRDDAYHRLFEEQQHFMEDLVRQHTVPLVEQQRAIMSSASPSSLSTNPLTAFSKLLGDDGFARAGASTATTAEESEDSSAGGGGKAKKASVKAAGRKMKDAKGKQKASVSHDGSDGEGYDGEGMGDAAAAAEGDVTAIHTTPPSYGRHIGPQCLRGGDACPFFVEGMCLPCKVADPVTSRDNHIFTLPSASLARKSVWWSEGKQTIKDILAAYEQASPPIRLTHAQLRYAAALTQGQVAIQPHEVDAFFAKIRYPLFVIDFEAVQFALPPFQKEVAYQSIPFQFSLDVFQNDLLTEEPTHYNYLHFGKGCSPNTDPRPGCIAELLRIVRLEREKKRAAMEASGELARMEAARVAAEAAEAAAATEGSSGRRGRKSKTPKKPKITKANPLEQPLRPFDGSFVAHYASFEKSCLEKLGQLVEQHKEEIKEFYFLDTLDLIKKACVHPNTHGSNSLKKVLPALCPDFQYGVFGSEVSPSDAAAGATDAASGAVEGQDEQKGENAMGVYRLWYHLEGGGTVQDLQRANRRLSGNPHSSAGGPAQTEAASPPAWSESVRTTMSSEERQQMWQTLRIQLLEYCSLDTKALYEIMREIHRARAEIPDGAPMDTNGWVFVQPSPRELDF